MTDDCRLGEARQFGQLTAADQLTKIISGGRPSGTQHESDVDLRYFEAFDDG